MGLTFPAKEVSSVPFPASFLATGVQDVCTLLTDI